MKINRKTEPRQFSVADGDRPVLSEVGSIELAPNELVVFVTASGSEFDVVRKSFGYYATPSLNVRLPSRGLRPALVVNESKRYYVLLVEPSQMDSFSEYLLAERQNLICWLDDDASLDAISRTFVSAADSVTEKRPT